MLFLIKAEAKPPFTIPLEELRETQLKQMEIFLSLKKSGKILFLAHIVGRRGIALVIDVDSHDELDKIILSWPMFIHVQEVEMIPLIETEKRQQTVKG
jgi:muconolactone delta-isomerase